jgi:pyruvate formate lyase activating enzyme
MDAANVDLKGFSERFYHELSSASLAPVLETLRYIRHETDVWLEITTLLIPGENDSDAELDQITGWVVSELGHDVPLHFTAFHPDYRLRDRPATPPATLRRARAIALRNGVRYAYTGNVRDREGGSTWCPECGAQVLGRDGYEVQQWRLRGGACAGCGTAIAGVYEAQPGSWGARRRPVRMLDIPDIS